MRGSRSVEGGRSGCAGDTNYMLDAWETYRFYFFAVEERYQDGLQLDETWVGVKKFRGEVNEGFVARSGFWSLKII